MAERQTATTLAAIRADHVGRYRFAAERLAADGARIAIDAGCGCGYGAALLADAGFEVTALDRSPEAIAFAALNWARPLVRYECSDLAAFDLLGADAVVCFEVLEHLDDAPAAVAAFRRAAPRLICSVPNEIAIPFDPKRFPFHKRHYTPDQFAALLRHGGWRMTFVGSQPDAHTAAIGGDLRGRTLVAECRADG
jgi:SAM-dependent methyltransferase